MNISTIIKNRRKELNLTSEEVAANLGISRATYYRYEKSAEKIPASIIEPLCETLKLAPAVLLGLNKLNSSITEAEADLNFLESKAELEIKTEQLAQVLGYCLVKDYAVSKDNNKISAIIYKDNIKLITEKQYATIINSIKEFTLFELNKLLEENQ